MPSSNGHVVSPEPVITAGALWVLGRLLVGAEQALICTGIQRYDSVMMLAGALPTSLLALAADGFLATTSRVLLTQQPSSRGGARGATK
jgi:ABC-type proline/glycine betaine transport system permease subunit